MARNLTPIMRNVLALIDRSVSGVFQEPDSGQVKAWVRTTSGGEDGMALEVAAGANNSTLRALMNRFLIRRAITLNVNDCYYVRED